MPAWCVFLAKQDSVVDTLSYGPHEACAPLIPGPFPVLNLFSSPLLCSPPCWVLFTLLVVLPVKSKAALAQSVYQLFLPCLGELLHFTPQRLQGFQLNPTQALVYSHWPLPAPHLSPRDCKAWPAAASWPPPSTVQQADTVNLE